MRLAEPGTKAMRKAALSRDRADHAALAETTTTETGVAVVTSGRADRVTRRE